MRPAARRRSMPCSTPKCTTRRSCRSVPRRGISSRPISRPRCWPAQDLNRELETVARRDAAGAARRCRAVVRARPVTAGDSRPGRRPRPHPRRRPARRRPVQPVGRSRRAGQSGERLEDRSGARAGDAAVRRERHRRPRQRHQRNHSHASSRRVRTAPSSSTPARRPRSSWAAPMLSVGQRAVGALGLAAAASATATSTRPPGMSRTPSPGRVRQRRRVVDRAEGLRRRQLRVRRHPVWHSLRRGRAGRADAAPAHVRRQGRSVAAAAARFPAFASTSRRGDTSTTKSSAAQIGTHFENDTDELNLSWPAPAGGTPDRQHRRLAAATATSWPKARKRWRRPSESAGPRRSSMRS